MLSRYEQYKVNLFIVNEIWKPMTNLLEILGRAITVDTADLMCHWLDITLGNRINKNVEGKTVTVRPAIVKDEPKVPIAWVAGYASVPKGMTVIGKNGSSILPRHLPVYARF